MGIAEDIAKTFDDLIERTKQPIQADPWLVGTPAMMADILLQNYASLPPELCLRADEILDIDGPVRQHFMESE